MKLEKALKVAEALLITKATDRTEIVNDEGNWHVGCYGFANRIENERIIQVSKDFKTKYDLTRDGFDLW